MSREHVGIHYRWYRVVGKVRYSCASLKSSRLSAGMTYTAARLETRQELSPDARKLALYGTLDPLARTNKMKEHRRIHFHSVQRWERNHN